MVRWENIGIPKDYGGLGVIDTRTMNEEWASGYGGC